MKTNTGIRVAVAFAALIAAPAAFSQNEAESGSPMRGGEMMSDMQGMMQMMQKMGPMMEACTEMMQKMAQHDTGRDIQPPVQNKTSPAPKDG